MTALDPAEHAMLVAALAWQIEAGVDECVSETPVDRFTVAEAARATAEAARVASKASAPRAGPTRPEPPRLDANRQDAVAPAPSADGEQRELGAAARALAAEATDLSALRAAMEGFQGSALKAGAHSTVFADGDPAARVMFIGEAPGRDEDREGKPFVGRSGQLLDRMLAAIGLDRRAAGPERGAYITNVLPWRPVDNRDPSTDEAEMLWAFLERHIALVSPEVIVCLGKIPAATLLDHAVAITRMRGRWLRPTRAGGRPVLLTLHPAYLLRQPAEKAKSWRDLLSLRAVLDGAPPPEG